MENAEWTKTKLKFFVQFVYVGCASSVDKPKLETTLSMAKSEKSSSFFYVIPPSEETSCQPPSMVCV